MTKYHPVQQKNISNIPEAPRYISSMTPIGFRNGQDESICYVNLSFQVLFSIYIFRTLIMNIDCKKYIENLDNNTDDYNGYVQKIMILQVIKLIFYVYFTINIHD